MPNISLFRVLVACERSGTVRDAFLKSGCYAASCDLVPSDSPGPHFTCDVRDVVHLGWDLIIAHPPCTYLSNSGVRWLHSRPGRYSYLVAAARFFRWLWDIPRKVCRRVVIENPVQHSHAKRLIGVSWTQVVQPWQFGHGVSKATCLWERGVEPLVPTDIVDGRVGESWLLPPTPDRGVLRSKTYPGIASAMASQWGNGGVC